MRITDLRDGPRDIDELTAAIISAGLGAAILPFRTDPRYNERVLDAVVRRLRSSGCQCIPAATITGSGVASIIDYYRHIKEHRLWPVYHWPSVRDLHYGRAIRELAFRDEFGATDIHIVDAPLIVSCEAKGEWIEWQT